MYECKCNTMKSLKVTKITTSDQNQIMTCYLFNFRATYFSYFRKITAISISYNVKKTSGPKMVHSRRLRAVVKELTSLGMSEVDTVWAWGGQTSTPPISKYFWEIFSASHIKLTYNNPNKDFESVKRP